MKKCNACGSENQENSSFCVKCGKPLSGGQQAGTKPQQSKRGSMELIIVYAVIIFVILGIVLTRKSWQPFLFRTNRAAVMAPATITYAWNVMPIGNTGFSIESPVELKPKFLKLPENVKALIQEMVTYGFASQPLSIDAVTVTYTGKVVPSLKGAEEGAIANFKRVPLVKDVQYASKPFSASGKNGTILEGTFSAPNDKMGFKAVILIDNLTMWQVVAIYRLADQDAVNAVERIIGSIKIAK